MHQVRHQIEGDGAVSEQLPLDVAGRWCPVPMGRAYADKPGSGPEGERCGTCSFARRHGHHGRYYWKCGLVLSTHGAATDIRLKTPACRKWGAKS